MNITTNDTVWHVENAGLFASYGPEALWLCYALSSIYLAGIINQSVQINPEF